MSNNVNTSATKKKKKWYKMYVSNRKEVIPLSHFQAHFEFISGMLAGIALTMLIIMFYNLIISVATADKKLKEGFDNDSRKP